MFVLLRTTLSSARSSGQTENIDQGPIIVMQTRYPEKPAPKIVNSVVAQKAKR